MRGAMDTVEALAAAYDQTEKLVADLNPVLLEAPTPCADWDVRATLDHLVSATWLFTMVNKGGAVGEDVGDVIGDNSASAVAAAAAANLGSWRQSDAFEGDRTYPFGTFPAPAAALVNLEEVVVHAWDIAKATGRTLTLDEHVTTTVYDFCLSIPLDTFRADGFFGPEVPVATTAPVLDRLVALLGRQP
jgi:uncharacterized protein (TIGR03086 family)